MTITPATITYHSRVKAVDDFQISSLTKNKVYGVHSIQPGYIFVIDKFGLLIQYNDSWFTHCNEDGSDIVNEPQDYIEIAGLRFCKENLKATPNDVDIFEKDGEIYFTREAGMREAKKQGLSIPTKEQREQSAKSMGDYIEDERCGAYKKLADKLGLKISGYRRSVGSWGYDSTCGYSRSSSENDTDYAWDVWCDADKGIMYYNNKSLAFPVRALYQKQEEKFDLSDQCIVIKDTYVAGYNMKEGMELVRKGDYYYVAGYLIKLSRVFINSSRTKEKPKQEEKPKKIENLERIMSPNKRDYVFGKKINELVDVVNLIHNQITQG